jgi:hypothetical protein
MDCFVALAMTTTSRLCVARSDASPSSSGLTGGSPDVDTDYRVKPDNDGGLSLDCFVALAMTTTSRLYEACSDVAIQGQRFKR